MPAPLNAALCTRSHWLDIFVDNILAQLLSTSVVVGVAGFAMKSWFTHHLSKLEKSNIHELNIQLESLKAQWTKETAKLNVHESYLNNKRVELIEDLYEQMLEAEFELQNFLLHWWAYTRKVNDGIYSEQDSAVADDSMRVRGEAFCEKYLYINSVMHKKALYFDDQFIESVLGAYKPYFDRVLELNYNQLSLMPEEFHDVVNKGREPRREVIDMFRKALGVTS